jgi:hypothetical protein
VWRPQLADPSIPHRAICPNCSAHASSSRWPSPETRKCSRGEDPAACVGDRRGQRPLMRVRPRRRCPHDRASSTDATVPDRACSLASLKPPRVCMLLADRSTTSRWTPCTGRTLLSGQADPRRQRTEADTSRGRHPSPGVRSLWSQTSVQPSSLTRTVAHAGDRNSTPGSLSRERRRRSQRSFSCGRFMSPRPDRRTTVSRRSRDSSRQNPRR